MPGDGEKIGNIVFFSDVMNNWKKRKERKIDSSVPYKGKKETCVSYERCCPFWLQVSRPLRIINYEKVGEKKIVQNLQRPDGPKYKGKEHEFWLGRTLGVSGGRYITLRSWLNLFTVAHSGVINWNTRVERINWMALIFSFFLFLSPFFGRFCFRL